MNESSVISQQRLFEYLIEKLQNELATASILIEEDTVWYLGNLLTQFSQSENFLIQEQHTKTLPTLAFLYRDARETHSAKNKQNLLRKLGDSALFMGAWFTELYRCKGINQDYFIGMGHAAYDYLSENACHQQTTFRELANKLPQLINLVSRVLSKNDDMNAEEIFALYKRWLSDKDESTKQQLASIGIVPVDSKFSH